VRAQRRTRNVVGLENALPQKVMMKHWSDNFETNSLWSICMYTLPEKCRSPFLHGVFLFSKVGVLVVNIDGFLALTYSSHLLWFWPLGRTWYHHTSLSSALYLKGCQFCPAFFLERESWSQPYQDFFFLPPAWSCPQVFNLGLGIRLFEGRFGFWQGVVFM